MINSQNIQNIGIIKSGKVIEPPELEYVVLVDVNGNEILNSGGDNIILIRKI